MHENIANNTQVNQIYELLLPVVYCTRIFVVVFVVRSLAHSSSFFVGVVCVCITLKCFTNAFLSNDKYCICSCYLPLSWYTHIPWLKCIGHGRL